MRRIFCDIFPMKKFNQIQSNPTSTFKSTPSSLGILPLLPTQQQQQRPKHQRIVNTITKLPVSLLLLLLSLLSSFQSDLLAVAFSNSIVKFSSPSVKRTIATRIITTTRSSSYSSFSSSSLPPSYSTFSTRYNLIRLYSVTPTGKDSALTTTRVPLTRIFNGEREYLFTTKRNVRNFEWTTTEIEDLFESILNLENDNRDDELELNAITILPANSNGDGDYGDDDYRQRIGRTSQIYDVHDGQQRLVTLCLLLAALRDNLLKWSEAPPPPPSSQSSSSSSDDTNYPNGQFQYENYYFDDDAREVSRAIFPVKSRLQHVTRIQLRDKHGQKWLYRILSKRDCDNHHQHQYPTTHDNNNNNIIINGSGGGGGGGSGGNGEIITEFQFPNARDRKNLLQPSERLIIEAYEYCYKRIEELGPQIALEVLLENFMSRVYLLICIPANTRIARNIVMGLGKGKNMEPVDEFKGMVCFNSIKDDENRQDLVLDEWNKLCEDVGRDIVQKACIVHTQLYLRRPIKKNCEVDMMEVFLKKYMDEFQQLQQQQQQQYPSSPYLNNRNGGALGPLVGNCRDGGYIFQEKIAPMARLIHSIQELNIEFIMPNKRNYSGRSISGRGRNRKVSSESKQQSTPTTLEYDDLPSIKFLWSICSNVATAKEMELVLLHLLMKWQSSIDTNHRLQIQQQLRQLESIALWMTVAQPKPPPAKRLKRCFDILDYCGTSESVSNSNKFNNIVAKKRTKKRKKGVQISDEIEEEDENISPLELTNDEKLQTLQAIDEFEFGSSSMRCNIAKIILDRLNESMLIQNSQGRITPIAATLQLEHVLPQKYDKGWKNWDQADADEWMHRLGNLALLNQKVNAKISNGSFDQKKDHLESSPYPLTRLIGKYKQWDVSSVQRHHQQILELATIVWQLENL